MLSCITEFVAALKPPLMRTNAFYFAKNYHSFIFTSKVLLQLFVLMPPFAHALENASTIIALMSWSMCLGLMDASVAARLHLVWFAIADGL